MLGKNFLKIILCCIMSVLLALGFAVWKVQEITGDAAGALKFLRAMSIVKNNFNGTANDAQLFEGAIAGMVKALDDPYTAYLDAKSYSALAEMTGGSFGGIGIVFGKRGDDYVVISALPDNPGALAGIRSGDKILAVNGEDARGMNMEEIALKIRGPRGTEVELKLGGNDGTERTVRVVRGEIKNVSVGGALLPDTKIGYLRVSVFNENTGADFIKKYRELEAQGMKATLLDLRGNPGGLLEDGVQVARLLVPKGPIVAVVDKNGNKFTESSSLEEVKYPLAVLVDHGSASASEIVAGAVKDTRAGKLFGVKTFGKGSVQSVYQLSADTALKVTTANYYTPSGISIHNVGIEPDVVVEMSDDAVTDKQLQAAKEYLLAELAGK